MSSSAVRAVAGRCTRLKKGGIATVSTVRQSVRTFGVLLGMDGSDGTWFVVISGVDHARHYRPCLFAMHGHISLDVPMPLAIMGELRVSDDNAVAWHLRHRYSQGEV